MNDNKKQFCSGNAKLIILINSNGRLCDKLHIDSFLFSGLRHCGIPYSVIDLGQRKPAKVDLDNCAEIIIAQENIIPVLDKTDWGIILAAVNSGVGLINFDPAFCKASASVQKELEISLEPYSVFTDRLRIPSLEHYIIKYQEHKNLIVTKKYVPVAAINTAGSSWNTILEAVIGREQLIFSRHLLPGIPLEPSHSPALMLRDYGKGKIVFFNLNLRFWLPEFYGHANGCDDIFFRTIVWAAKKPFITKSLPRFVTLRVDDCSGIHDFNYIETIAKYGLVPSIACFLDKISDKHWKKLKKYQEQGIIKILSHAFSYYDLLYFNFGIGECSETELTGKLRREENIFSRQKLKPGKIAHVHCNELGINALPKLKQRNQTLLEFPPFSPGTTNPGRTPVAVPPYSSRSMGYDRLPEDRDFFRYYSRFQTADMVSADFLEGNVLTWLGQQPANNIPRGIENGTGQLNLGLNSIYFGQLITHEQKFSVMTLEEIDSLFRGIVNCLKYDNIRFGSIETIAEYLKYHYGSHLTSVNVNDQDYDFEVASCDVKPEDAVVQIHYQDFEEEINIQGNK